MDLNALENIKSKIDLSSVGKPALIGLAILLVMVAVAAGRFGIDAATANEIQLQRTNQEAEGLSPQAESNPGALDAEHENHVIFVHVSGAVKKAGLVELESGARVADAIEAAGGPSDNACTEAVNLARKVEDGEHVHLPSAEEDERGTEAPAQSIEQLSQDNVTGKVNINTASSDELEKLPGIGPSTAQKIIADRSSNGPYETPEELKRVSGIGDKKFSALEDLICV